MSEFEQPIVDDRNPRTLAQFMPVVFVLLLAAWLRIIGGDHFPVSTDEGWTTWAITEPTFRAIWDLLAAERQPPLYFLILGYWSRIAGDSHLALRLPSMLMGVLTVAMIYRIGADTFGRTARPGREDVAWYGMLMFALLPVAVYYSQEMRHYGWFVASAVWSSLLFIRILRAPHIPLVALYAASTAVMFYIMHYALWVLSLHVFVGIVLWRGDASRNWMVPWRDKGKLAIGWAAVLVMYIPWLTAFFTEQDGILAARIVTTTGTFSSSLGDLLLLLQLLAGGGLALTGGLYVIGLWGSLVSDRTDVTLGLRFANPAWLGELFIVFWGLGLIILMALVNIWAGILSPQTTLFISPALMLVVGAGIVRLRVGVRWSLLAGYVVVSIFLPPNIEPRPDYDVTLEALETQISPGDVVMLETGRADHAFGYELGLERNPDVEIIRTLSLVNSSDETVTAVSQLEDQLQSQDRVWIVQGMQPSQIISSLQENGYTKTMTILTEFSTAEDVSIVRLARPADRGDATFGELLTLTGSAFDESAVIGGDFAVDLWWKVKEMPDLDYLVGLSLLDSETPVAELNLSLLTQPNAIYRYTLADGLTFADPTTFAEHPTSTWDPSTMHYTRYVLPIPADVSPGEYTLALRVYNVASADEPLMIENEPQYNLGMIQLENR